MGEVDDSIADFAVPRQAADYRLTYDIDTSAVLPVSTRVTTVLDVPVGRPGGTGSIPLPLLSVDYALPLDTANHPIASGTATFTVRQAHGVRAQAVTSFDAVDIRRRRRHLAVRAGQPLRRRTYRARPARNPPPARRSRCE